MTNDLRNHAADILAGLPIYLIEALERKVRDRAEFYLLLNNPGRPLRNECLEAVYNFQQPAVFATLQRM